MNFGPTMQVIVKDKDAGEEPPLLYGANGQPLKRVVGFQPDNKKEAK